MNKFLIFTLCTFVMVLSPVFATDTNNGVDLQQVQNSQDVYNIINTYFTSFVQNLGSLTNTTQNSDFHNLSSQITNNGTVQTQFNNFLQTSNIQSTINSTLQYIETQVNIDSIMNNPELQNIINTAKSYMNQN